MDIPDHPQKGDCYFCRKSDHWSFLCTEKATVQQRENVYKEHGACTTCACSHTGTCMQKPKHTCNWFYCCAVDQHHTALCPLAPYPLTTEKVTQWYRQLHALQRLFPSDRIRQRKLQASTQNKQFDHTLQSDIKNTLQIIDTSPLQDSTGTMKTLLKMMDQTTPEKEESTTTTEEQLYSMPQNSKNISIHFTFAINNNISGFLLFSCQLFKEMSSQRIQVNGFFDSGSRYTYLLEDFALNDLQLKPLCSKNISFIGVQNQRTTIFVSHIIRFYLHDNYNTSVHLQAYTVQDIASTLPAVNLTHFLAQYPQYKTEHFAQPLNNKPITLLVGTDAMWLFIRSIKHLNNSLRLIDTTLGYMVAYQQPQVNYTKHAIKEPQFLTIEQSIEKIWTLDSIGIVTKNQSDYELEKTALNDFLKNIKIQNGRYQARWP